MSVIELGMLDRVHQLREHVRLQLERPRAVEAEREQAVGGVETARRELQLFYAGGGKPGGKGERDLIAGLEAAEAAAGARWDDRLAGARLGVRQAREALRVFVADHFDQIAAELVPQAVAAGRELRDAEAQLAAAREEHERVLGEWWPLLGPAGIAREDLPDVGSSELPLPRSLLPLADELGADAPGTENTTTLEEGLSHG